MMDQTNEETRKRAVDLATAVINVWNNATTQFRKIRFIETNFQISLIVYPNAH